MKTYFSFVLLLALAGTASAQKSGGYSGPRIHVELGGTTGTATSVATSQTASNGRVVHDLTVTGPLGVLMETVTMTCELMSKRASSPMSVIYVNPDGVISEVREYSGVTVTSIDFPGFNGASKSPIVITIKLRADGLQTKPGGGKFASKIGSRQKALLESQFKMKVNELPTTTLSRISSFRILPALGTGGAASDSITQFEIWVRGIEGGPWLQWFADATANPSKSKDGEITLLSPDLKTEVATIILYKLLPTGYEDISSPEGSKAHVHLRAERVRIKFDK